MKRPVLAKPITIVPEEQKEPVEEEHKEQEQAQEEHNESIADLDRLYTVLQNEVAQKELVFLYSESQSECTRNGKLGMEIGMSREKDQGAVLRHHLGDAIRLDLDNDLPEDYLIGTEKISAKHSSGRIGTPVKVKWTSSDECVQEVIDETIRSAADPTHHPHLLLTYIDMKKNIITILCITSRVISTVIQTLHTAAFKIPGGNSRGVEYSPAAMKAFLASPYFKVEIRNANIQGGVDPIERRIRLLRLASPATPQQQPPTTPAPSEP